MPVHHSCMLEHMIVRGHAIGSPFIFNRISKCMLLPPSSSSASFLLLTSLPPCASFHLSVGLRQPQSPTHIHMQKRQPVRRSPTELRTHKERWHCMCNHYFLREYQSVDGLKLYGVAATSNKQQSVDVPHIWPHLFGHRFQSYPACPKSLY